MSTDSASSPLFEFRDLRIDFGEGPLFQPFSASVYAGEKVHLQADSGGGKSSLLKSLMGFIHVAEGDLLFHGEALSATGYNRIRSEVFYLPQNPNLVSATPRESWNEIGNFRRNRGGWPEIDVFAAMLKVFDLPPEVLSTEFTTLSGGEKQRVLLALGAASGREIFLLDEALSGLDSRRRERVLDFYGAQKTWTLILVSHDESLPLTGSRKLTLEAP